MTQLLPVGEIQLMDDQTKIRELFPDDLEKWPSIDGEYGYALEVDLDYPESIHDKTASYPLAPAHEDVAMEDLSLTQLKYYLSSHKCHIIGQERKLVASCRPKQNYVVHYRTLRLYVELGLKITKIHSIVKFRQAPWLRDYINKNIERRKAATAATDKDFFKRRNNAVFKLVS